MKVRGTITIKNAVLCVLVGLLAVAMVGCTAASSSVVSQSVASSEASAQVASSQPEALAQSGEAKSLLVEADTPVPDFLDKDQQILYRQAQTAYKGFRLAVDSFGYIESDGSSEANTPPIEINGITYYRSSSAIATWADFETSMLSVFTPSYLKELNTFTTEDASGATVEQAQYVEQNGDLYSTQGARGGNITFIAPETFELIAKDDKKIEFYLIGTYDDFAYDENGEMILDEAGEFKHAGNPTTEKQVITMENGADGWRFSKFALAY